jgi:putative lipoic acid-binding regulatory protein
MDEQGLKLKYPCQWIYKIIGLDEDHMRSIVSEIIKERACTTIHSRSSRTGKYHCLNLQLQVESDDDRTGIYEALRRHPAIKMVL